MKGKERKARHIKMQLQVKGKDCKNVRKRTEERLIKAARKKYVKTERQNKKRGKGKRHAEAFIREKKKCIKTWKGKKNNKKG